MSAWWLPEVYLLMSYQLLNDYLPENCLPLPTCRMVGWQLLCITCVTTWSWSAKWTFYSKSWNNWKYDNNNNKNCGFMRLPEAGRSLKIPLFERLPSFYLKKVHTSICFDHIFYSIFSLTLPNHGTGIEIMKHPNTYIQKIHLLGVIWVPSIQPHAGHLSENKMTT